MLSPPGCTCLPIYFRLPNKADMPDTPTCGRQELWESRLRTANTTADSALNDRNRDEGSGAAAAPAGLVQTPVVSVVDVKKSPPGPEKLAMSPNPNCGWFCVVIPKKNEVVFNWTFHNAIAPVASVENEKSLRTKLFASVNVCTPSKNENAVGVTPANGVLAPNELARVIDPEMPSNLVYGPLNVV